MGKLEAELTLEALKCYEHELYKYYDVTREAVYKAKLDKVRQMITELELKIK